MFKDKFFHISYLTYGCLFFFILIGTVWLYWPGLYSIFLFDDKVNLHNLVSINDTFTSLLFFTLDGDSGPLGRPVSLFTFALQAASWPIPWDFKYINLMIHLLNGCLIFWFLLSLSRLMELPEKRSLFLAFLTTSIWLLHPLQISTVLYVIQRMTQLSVLFTLFGLLAYLYGRQFLAQNKLKLGFFWVSVGVGLGGILATLSKENGILLVLYIIVLEITVLHHLSKPRYWKVWTSIFLYLPLFLLAIYFITHLDSLLKAYEIRNFTMGERLLTQTSILTDYLSKILLLKPYNFGLFHDDYPISHHLLIPPTTLIFTSFIIAMLSIALWKRRVLPILSFGVLWFFAGHILESSFVGLMLYFEHRNYLPMLGIIFTTLYGFLWLFDYLLNVFLRRVAIFVSVLLLALVPFLTGVQIHLWSHPIDQAVFWAQQHPRSLAAQTHASVFFQKINEDIVAEQYIQTMINTFPEYAAPSLYLIGLACRSKEVEMPNLLPIIQHFQTTQSDHATPEVLKFILAKRKRGICHIDSEIMDNMLKTLINNPNNAYYKAHFSAHYATFHAFEERYGLAIQMGKQALALKDSIYLRLKIIKWLMVEKQFDEAMAFLSKTKNQLNPIKRHFYHKELILLEAQIPVMKELHEMGFQVEEK